MQALAIKNSNKQLLTQGNWLLHSLYWTVASLAGWLLLSSLLTSLLVGTGRLLEVLLFGIAAGAHALIWYKAVLSSSKIPEDKPEPFWLTTVSALWTFGLLLFQVICLLLWFLGLLLACDTTSSTWN